jgi:hypothetical protein
MPETCWAVFERRAINLRDWCIWLVDLFECVMMQGLTNPKKNVKYHRYKENEKLHKNALILWLNFSYEHYAHS